jgi:hypothetical protein
MKLGRESIDPVSLKFAGQGDHDVEIWEHPLNGQGIVALIALGILEHLERSPSSHRRTTIALCTFSPSLNASASPSQTLPGG